MDFGRLWRHPRNGAPQSVLTSLAHGAWENPWGKFMGKVPRKFVGHRELILVENLGDQFMETLMEDKKIPWKTTRFVQLNSCAPLLCVSELNRALSQRLGHGAPHDDQNLRVFFATRSLEHYRITIDMGGFKGSTFG